MIYDSCLFFLNFCFSRFTPSTPSIVSPPYWNVFAIPKSMNHNTPLSSTEIGRAIWAKERI